MTQPTIDLTEAQIVGVIGDFLTSVVLAGTGVILGQTNLVPEPAGQDYVVMWPTFRARMAYNIDHWAYIDAPVEITEEAATKVVFQFDVHGPLSNDNAQIIATLWNDDYAAVFFDGKGFPIRPTFMEDGQQMPFINGEQQYENRWALRAELQGNFTISTPQDFADTIGPVGLINVDVVYPG